MPRKIRAVKQQLQKAGFQSKPGKGSHVKWKHPLLAKVIVIARKDGDDAPLYLEKQVSEALQQIKAMEEGE
ncbi:MAG: type II toxin-antitoxin system HicA family toxin [Cyanothece sp. SIO1E1]|nr:type II toxin-antitoxin system HicA family toxin [Cyanothece sp. SIO1E1]